jgi:phosphoglycerol transferase MdoB-like AlkP superfamily enzyme
MFDSSISPRHKLTFVTFAGSSGVLLCLVSPIFLLPGRARGVCLVALDFALSLLILTDELYLRYYSDLFSLRNIGLSAQAGAVSDSIAALFEARDVKYFADLPIFMLLLRLSSKNWRRAGLSLARAAGVLAFLALGASGVAWKIRDYDRAVPGAIRSLWDRPAVAISTGTLVYHASDALGIVDEMFSRKIYSAEDKKNLAGWLESRRGNEREDLGSSGEAFGAAKGKNLIMIQVESLQSFVLGLEAGGVEVTPNINRLAAESLVFTRAFNQTASGNSSDAEFMSNTSLFPTAKGVAFMRFAGNHFDSLGSELKSRGYATAAFHADRPGFWNRGHMYPALGFERYFSRNDFEPGERIGLGLSDRDFFGQSLLRLAEMRDGARPFYAFLVTLSSHYPFNFGAFEKYLTDIEPGPLGDLGDSILGNYLRSVQYADEQIGNFLMGLERENLLDESLIVLYGDHPAIPRAEASSLALLVGRDLSSVAAWREVQSVVMMIRLPGGKPSRTIDTPAGQMDIAPTVASLMGFSMRAAFGDDLLDPSVNAAEKFVIFRNGSFVKGNFWVRPGENKAFDLTSHEAVPYAERTAEWAGQAGALLYMSDMVLEDDMLRRSDADIRSPSAGR